MSRKVFFGGRDIHIVDFLRNALFCIGVVEKGIFVFGVGLIFTFILVGSGDL